MKSRVNKIIFHPRADSVENNREGGAMYIESSPSNADGYVPNSSLFGPWIDSPTQVKIFVLVIIRKIVHRDLVKVFNGKS